MRSSLRCARRQRPRALRARVPQSLSLDGWLVVHQVRQLRDEQQRGAKREDKQRARVDLKGVREVNEMPAEAVTAEIERVFAEAVESIMQGKSFSFQVPSRSQSNQEYVLAVCCAGAEARAQ